MKTMSQASILMTFFVGVMGVVWYALETGMFDRDVSQAAQFVASAAASEQPAARFSAKVDREALPD
jgi:hypothetical protein